MAYVNTGYARNKTLTVTKGSYTHDYDLCAGFVYDGRTFPSISDDGLAQFSDAGYQTRLSAFIGYVYSLEPGLETDCPNIDVGGVIYDTVSCPLPGTGTEPGQDDPADRE